MKAIKNWQTTLWGFMGGVATYLTLAGAQMPHTKQELGAFMVGLFIAGMGAAAKDGSTGSAPGATS